MIGGVDCHVCHPPVFGTVIGLFIPSTLQDGFVILGVQPFWQQVVVGAVLIAAVYVDQARRAAAQRGSRAARPRFLSLWGVAERKETP